MSPLVIQILLGIQMALDAAPKVKKLYDNARTTISMLFSAGLITAEQQNQLRAWADKHEADTLAGHVPEALKVEPDPA